MFTEASKSVGEVVSSGSAARQAALWGARAEDWAALQENAMAPLYDAVLRRFARAPATRIVDLGCGAGGFLAMARKITSHLEGFDATRELLAIATRRLPDVRFQAGDIESLPYADASFDLVTGFNAFQYAASPIAALAEARRVVRKGGHVVVATWGKPENCEAAGHLAAMKALMPPAPPGAAGPFALSDESVLKDFVVKAGLKPIDVADVSCTMAYADAAEALRGLLSSGPATLAIRTSGEDKVRAAVLDSIAAYRTTNGGYRLENQFRYVAATA